MRIALTIFVAVTALRAIAQSPAEALRAGRAQIATDDCSGAIATMQNAVPAAVALEPESTRNAALAALHFYTALAFSNCKVPLNAKQELHEFFRFHSGGSLDPKSYPAEFVKLFDEVSVSVDENRGPTSFEHFYPRFNTYSDVPLRVPPLNWAGSTEFVLYATDEERAEWSRFRDDESRVRFIDEFWRRRDPDPETAENSIQDDVRRRIAFADRAFGDELGRGSLSDRGKVFVLLGLPARVYVSNFTRRDGAFVGRSRLPYDGTLERWVYFKPQLPPGVPVNDVQFRFVTQTGYGDHVMEKDFWPLKALGEAKKAGYRRAE